jgi:hypothetical protein
MVGPEEEKRRRKRLIETPGFVVVARPNPSPWF